MLKLVVLGGTGDVYLIAALYESFCNHHQRNDAVLVTRQKFAAVVDLFPHVPYEIDEAQVDRGEHEHALHAEYDNRLDSPDGIFFTHPCFERSRVRVDHMTTKVDASQADMYRMLLRIPPDAPLTQPVVPMIDPPAPNRVLIIPDAVSWPNTQADFWPALGKALEARWEVVFNDREWPLDLLLRACAASGWVIGPQCGVMSILCTGSFPCRKTLATPSVDHERSPGFLARETFPYAYVTKFANNDYDVEEFKISLENRAEVIDAIANGSNALRLWPHNPAPLPNVTVSMSPGEVLDRLAVLSVKRHRFPPNKRAAVEREYRRYSEVARLLLERADLMSFYQRMVICHEKTFDVLEGLVPEALLPDHSQSDILKMLDKHIDAMYLNRERTELRQAADAASGTARSEVKSYYGKEDMP